MSEKGDEEMINSLENMTKKTKSLRELRDEYAKEACVYPIPTESYALGNINENNEFVKYLFQFVNLTKKISYNRECHIVFKTDSNKRYSNYLSYFLFHRKDDWIKYIGVLSPILLPESLKEMAQRYREGGEREDPVRPWLAISRSNEKNYKAEFMGVLDEYKDCDVLVNPKPLKGFLEIYSKTEAGK